MQSAYFWVIFHLKHKKITIFRGLAKSKMATIFGHVTGPQRAPPPIKYTSSCIEDQRLSTEVKSVWKYCNISKTVGRVPSLGGGGGGGGGGGQQTPPPPPPSLVPRLGYEFAYTSRVNHQ